MAAKVTPTAKSPAVGRRWGSLLAPSGSTPQGRTALIPVATTHHNAIGGSTQAATGVLPPAQSNSE